MDKSTRLQDIVDEAENGTLSSGTRRKGFATYLARELGLWEPQVQSFVGEMSGLNFYRVEDRRAFVDFFHLAFSL